MFVPKDDEKTEEKKEGSQKTEDPKPSLGQPAGAGDAGNLF